jgi:hypothetical protein
MPRPALRLIEWEDAYNGNHDWIDVATIPETVEPLIITTVGFELCRDRERVTLAMSYGSSRDDPEREGAEVKMSIFDCCIMRWDRRWPSACGYSWWAV